MVLASPYVKVTLHELSTVYGQEDLWWLLEVHTISAFNHGVVNEQE